MTTEEIRAVATLRLVTFPPYTADKRFFRDISKDNARVLSEKQHDYLLRLLHKYRGQHGQCRCEICKGVRKIVRRELKLLGIDPDNPEGSGVPV